MQLRRICTLVSLLIMLAGGALVMTQDCGSERA